ncbi:MAG: TDT family transporter [Acetobacter papayae]
MTLPNSIKKSPDIFVLFGKRCGSREVIRQFTPNWFAATMGTGILALTLPQMSGIGPLLSPVGEGLWFVTIGLFLLFSALYAARWILYGQEARRIFGHSVVSMFIGTIPMGLATIINGCCVFGLSLFGSSIISAVQALWWVDTAMALACGVGIPYLMFTRHQISLESMTAVWLLPVVAAEVAGATGGLLVPHLADAHAGFVVLITSYVLWAYSVPVALSILAILILRMALHKLSHESMAASCWLALGPVGTGALGMLVMGEDAPAVFAAHGLARIGVIAQGVGVMAGLVLWALGVWWLVLALLITGCYLRSGIPFNLGWWGYTFPLGVYVAATYRLGLMLDLAVFGYIATVLTLVLAFLWLVVASRTLAGAWKGDLFVSPCIATRM